MVRGNTYIRIHEGWRYLACSTFGRAWPHRSTGQRIDTRLVLDASTLALWRRRLKQLLVHSDQGCQFTDAAEVLLKQAETWSDE